MERKLRALRQEHEKVRSQFEVRQTAAEERESRADMRRIKEMEKQLADVRPRLRPTPGLLIAPASLRGVHPRDLGGRTRIARL